MKFKILFSLLLLVILKSPAAFAVGGDSGGNAGGGLRLLFQGARDIAVEKLKRLTRCSFDERTPIEVREWILANKNDLIEDVIKSDHEWRPVVMGTDCAFTFEGRNNVIYFSKKYCTVPRLSPELMDSIPELVAQILIHESIHHFKFNFDEESFADRAASGIMKAREVLYCPGEDPFSEKNCGVPPKADFKNINFPVGTVRPTDNAPGGGLVKATVGKYQLFTRQRECNNSNSCKDWRTDQSLTRQFVDKVGRIYLLPIVGDIEVTQHEGSLYMFFKTLGDNKCIKDQGFVNCTLGVGGENASDLYQEINGTRQALTFTTFYMGQCLRQHAKLVFPNKTTGGTTEVEHLIYGPH